MTGMLRLGLIGLTLSLAACVSAPPRLPIPALPALGVGIDAGDPVRSPPLALRWWTAFEDAELDRLVDQGLAGNPGLEVLAARWRQAHAAAIGAGAARAPKVHASVDLIDQRFTENGMVPRPLAGSTAWNNNAQVAASWDLDLFGAQRAAIESALGQRQAVAAELVHARQQLAAQLVLGWIQLGRIEAQREALSSLVRERDVQLDLVAQRIRAGLDTEVDRSTVRAQRAQALAEWEGLAEAAARVRGALAEASGQPPEALASARPRLEPRGARLPSTVPVDWLGRRADVMAQRWRVEAAYQETEVARAQFYPNVSLTAFVGLASLGLSNLVDLGSRQHGVGPALRLPVFEGGRLKAQWEGRRAEVDAAVAGYQGALLRAMREVADELATLQAIERQQLAQDEALRAARHAYDLATQRYRGQLGNQLQVLAAHQGVIAAERAEIELRARRWSAQAGLARALGGGWTPGGRG